MVAKFEKSLHEALVPCWWMLLAFLEIVTRAVRGRGGGPFVGSAARRSKRHVGRRRVRCWYE
jgi:hypothetical protein